jgi:RHS repeat-associated protein
MKHQPVIHHIEYMPSGEQFSEQRDIWATPYKFNGKELDQETGLYYYGARYYTPEIGIWLSACPPKRMSRRMDPLSDNAPEWSPYVYCFNNPVKLVDPDGKFPWEAKNVRDARKHARNNGGKFEQWKSKRTGQTFASVNRNTSGTDGVVEAHSKVFKPEGKSWGQSIKDFLNIGQGKGSDGGSRSGTMWSTDVKDASPQGPAVKTDGDIGDNAYSNVDNFPTLKSGNNWKGLLGLFGVMSDVANGFNIGDKVVGGVQNMSTNKSEGEFYIEKQSGWIHKEKYSSSKDSANKQK